MSQSSRIAALRWEPRKFRAEKNTWHLAAVRLQPLPVASPEETQDVSGYWPQMAEVHIKGMISVSPDSCILPYIEKR